MSAQILHPHFPPEDVRPDDPYTYPPPLLAAVSDILDAEPLHARRHEPSLATSLNEFKQHAARTRELVCAIHSLTPRRR